MRKHFRQPIAGAQGAKQAAGRFARRKQPFKIRLHPLVDHDAAVAVLVAQRKFQPAFPQEQFTHPGKVDAVIIALFMPAGIMLRKEIKRLVDLFVRVHGVIEKEVPIHCVTRGTGTPEIAVNQFFQFVASGNIIKRRRDFKRLAGAVNHLKRERHKHWDCKQIRQNGTAQIRRLDSGWDIKQKFHVRQPCAGAQSHSHTVAGHFADGIFQRMRLKSARGEHHAFRFEHNVVPSADIKPHRPRNPSAVGQKLQNHHIVIHFAAHGAFNPLLDGFSDRASGNRIQAAFYEREILTGRSGPFQKLFRHQRRFGYKLFRQRLVRQEE